MIGNDAAAIEAYWAAPVAFLGDTELFAVSIELLSWELVGPGVSSTLRVGFALSWCAFEFL